MSSVLLLPSPAWPHVHSRPNTRPSTGRTRAILCHSKNVKEIYYQYEDELEAPPAESASDAALSAPAAAAAAAPAPVAVAASTGPVASIEDVPVKAIDILLVIIAQKLKKRIDEIPLSKTIKDLVGGKSTLQNEISYSKYKAEILTCNLPHRTNLSGLEDTTGRRTLGGATRVPRDDFS